MSIIYSYKKQKTLNAGDMLVGTSVEKVGGKQKNLTRNFTLQQVADFLNIKGKISISGQMTFKFTNNLIPLGGEFSGPAFDSDIVNITTVQISSVDVSSQNTTAFMQYLVGTDILISEQNNISAFGHFNVVSYTQDGTVYTLNLANIGGNGIIEEDKYYDFATFVISTYVPATFVFDQVVPSTTWNINHDLKRFPSITVIDTANTVVVGEYEYIDDSNVTLKFLAGFAGKAYLN
jgi:hypothetical protein